MNKLDHALYNLQHMDTIAARDQWVNQLHPLVKLALTILFIAATVSFPKYNLTGLIRMGVYPIAVFILGEVSFRYAIKRLRIMLPFVCFLGIFNPMFDRHPVLQFGQVVVTTGMISMLTMIIKGIYAVLAAYLLIATTTIEKICYAMRQIHIPPIIVTQILLTYRYVSVLLSETSRILQAYALRAPKQQGIHFKVWGSLAGQLLLRSMDRAKEVYESMTLRGFNGEFYYDGKRSIAGRDMAWFLCWMTLFVLLKFL